MATNPDLYRLLVGYQLAAARRDLRKAIYNQEQARAMLTEAKERRSDAQQRVNDLSYQMEQIETGNYTPRLFGGAADKRPAKKKPEQPTDRPVGEVTDTDVELTE